MQYTKEELDKILANHIHWIKEDVKGWQNMRADLGRADLGRADLRGANLRGAKSVPFVPMSCPDSDPAPEITKARKE